MRVAFTTFAVLKHPYGDARVQEFDDRTPAVFLEAEQSPGFIDRARPTSSPDACNFEQDWGAWGKFTVPRFYVHGRSTGTDQRADTLSLWTDLASVFAFVYSGLHLAAFKKRAEWFQAPAWPTYAVWWVQDSHVPTWQEAAEKLEQLHDLGPTLSAFDFKRCFDEHGQRLDLSALKSAALARAEHAAP
jgi:hypothetical protein